DGQAHQEPRLVSRRALETPRRPPPQRGGRRRLGSRQRGDGAQVAELAGEAREKEVADLTERRPRTDEQLPRVPGFAGVEVCLHGRDEMVKVLGGEMVGLKRS